MVQTRRGALRQSRPAPSAKQPAAEEQHHLLLDVDVVDLILHRLEPRDALSLLGAQRAYARTHAMLRRFIDAYRHLLEANANIDHQNNSGSTALILSAQNRHDQVCALCFDY